ncbi:MAG: DNA polymerase III subunit delta [Dehalococcoidia bacterium]
MLLIFYGPDNYSRAEAVRLLKQELDADNMLSTNTTTLDGARVTPAELFQVCDTVPFLAAHRLAIVSDLLGRAQAQRPRSRGGRPRTEVASGWDPDELAAYVSRLPPTTTLLLLDAALREDNPLLRALKPLGKVRFFAQPGPDETAAWIRRRAADLGAAFEPRAVTVLAQLATGNLWVLSGEVDKLALYATGRAVTESDVRQMVAAAQESNIFSMVDAIVEGRLEPALRQVRVLMQSGAAGPYLITMIARQYRQLIVVQDLTQARTAPAEIARAAEIRSEGLMRRLQQQLRRWNPTRLQTAYERILAADLSIKRGEADEEVALELLVGDLVTT